MTAVLITGGAGFIGANLVAYLSAHPAGYDITVLDNESQGQRTALAGFDLRFIAGDIRDPQALDQAVAGQDCVVHLAADTRVMDSITDPSHNFDTNVAGSFALLQACRRHGVNRVVAASTGGAILGEAPPPVHEGMVAQPLSPYGASKLAMEGYLSAFTGAYGLSTCALRFSNIYGPGSARKSSVVAHFIKQILAEEELVIYGDGTQARDYLFVSDLCEAIRLTLHSDLSGPCQLGSGRPTTLSELTGMLSDVTGRTLNIRHAPFRAGELHSTWCDISRARAELGFAPDTALRAGLEQTWAWFT